MNSRVLRLFGPSAALLLLASVLAPLPSVAQTDPTATPEAGATATATEPATNTATSTATATPALTTMPADTTPVATSTVERATATVTPTLTPTATVTATVTATAAEAGEATATVRTSAGVRLRVRSGPGSNYPIVARLANGQTVNVLGRDTNGQWLFVELGGRDGDAGWISTNYATTNTPVAQLPVSSARSQATAAVAVTPAPGPLPGKIAVPIFDTERQSYNVWMVDADGGNLRLVVESASSPALSDDGTLLAYRHWQRDDRGIVVANSDGSNPLRLTDKLEDVLPSFAPDKTKIVFSTYRQGDRLSRIYYVWTDEQNQRAWEWGAGGLFGEDPDWMTDGQIAFHTTGETDQLWLMSGDATNKRAFFSTASIAAIAAAPDSGTIAYMGNVDGNWDIYRVNTQGGNLQRLTDDPARDGLPAWSPDGQSIAFVSDRSGQWALWVMDQDGGNERMLALLPGPVDGRVQFEPDYLNNGWLEEQIAWSW